MLVSFANWYCLVHNTDVGELLFNVYPAVKERTVCSLLYNQTVICV